MDLVKAIMKDNYMILEEDEKNILSYVTREHGDMSTDTAGVEDISHAYAMKKRIDKEIIGVTVEVETCDEWTYLNVILN